MNSTKMSTYTKTSKPNIYKLPSGTYRARMRKNGVRYSLTTRTIKEATLWLNRIKAMPTV